MRQLKGELQRQLRGTIKFRGAILTGGFAVSLLASSLAAGAPMPDGQSGGGKQGGVGLHWEPSLDLTPKLAPGIGGPQSPGAGQPGGVIVSPEQQQGLRNAFDALKAGQFDEALKSANALIDGKGPAPVVATAYEIIGSVNVLQGKTEDAAAAFKKAIAVNPKQATALVKLGVISRDAGKLDEAKGYFEKAIAAGSPGNYAPLYLGDIHERQGDLVGAAKFYEQAIAADKDDNVKLRVHLGTVYNRINRFNDTNKLLEPIVTPEYKDVEGLLARGIALAGSGDAKAGLPYLVAAKALSPDDYRLDLAVGTARRQAGEMDAALVILKQIVATHPEVPSAQYELGLTYLAKGQYAEARGPLAEAVRLAPTALDAKRYLGEALMRGGKQDEALALFKDLAKRDGAPLADQVNLVNAQRMAGRLPDAERAARDALRQYPKDPVSYALLAGVLGTEKKFDEARTVIADGRKIAADDPRLLIGLSEIEQQAGKPAAAIAAAHRLVEVSPTSIPNRLYLADLYGRSNERKQAIVLYRAILTEQPDNLLVMNNLAATLTDDGDAKAALPYAKRVAEAQPNNAAVMDTYGWALFKSGQTKEALAPMEAATRLAPDYPELLYHLGLVQKALGKGHEARASLEKALSLAPTFPGSVDAKAQLAGLPK